MRSLFSAFFVVQACMIAVGFFVLGSGPVFAQSPTLTDHENRIRNLESDVQDLDGRVNALENNEGNGNGQNGPFVLVGYTTDVFQGGVGVTGLNFGCADEFEPSARTCKTTEFVLSGNTPPLNGDGAWIFPDVAAMNDQLCLDSSGIARPCGSFTCAGWTVATAASRGLYVTVGGGLNDGSCDALRSVACCAPAQ